MIHAGSARRLKPFVLVDCMASDESALERQLFGADPAAPGSSAGSHPALAHGGSLFLDDVDGLSSRLQAKIVRALKERRGRRVGASRFFDIDARVLAASTQELQRLCSSSVFRENFYWYLNVVPIVLCPLRERVEDVEALAQCFLQTFLSHKHRRQQVPSGFTPLARRLLLHYAWPGNVRELRNVIERAAVFADGSLIDLVH